ncbi:MAG TPA: Zn-dependent hydrolase [Nitrolancea sp.]|nr:Zn-dependent hydrolase [Nitrolancea sp.]
MDAEIDGEKLVRNLQELGQIGLTARGGLMRVAFSQDDLAGRAWVAERMRPLMDVRLDPAGNTIGCYPGREPDLKPIALGSHTDTVPDGGRYDGALGVLAAIACVEALSGAGVKLRHPVEVINFNSEEAAVAGGTFGSRAMAGQFDPSILEQTTPDGRRIADIVRTANLDPEHIVTAARPKGSLAAYLELHPEQGGRLETAGIPIGVVDGIVAIRRYIASFHGYANHAGTTPMDQRRDALVVAAPFILAVRSTAIVYDIVGTVGTVRVEPGASNVIPGRVDLSVEIRGMDDGVLDAVEGELRRLALGAGAEFGRAFSTSAVADLKPISGKSAVRSDPWLVVELEAACQEVGLPSLRMSSGAGHDAMCMAAITREAMLFVPSRGGVSHSPDEFTSDEHCIAGARALFAALLRIDQRLDSASDS